MYNWSPIWRAKNEETKSGEIIAKHVQNMAKDKKNFRLKNLRKLQAERKQRNHIQIHYGPMSENQKQKKF